MDRKSVFVSVASCMLCAGLVATSCNGNSNANTASANKDESSVNNIIGGNALEEGNSENSEDMSKITTPDLAFYYLHGPVKYMQQGDFICHFNEKGELISYNGYNPFEGNCYDQGYYNPRITLERGKDKYIEGESGWEWGTDYTWKDGRIIKENTQAEADVYKYNYKYDDNGDLVRMDGVTYMCEEEDDRTEIKLSFTYGKRDSYGNWLERTRKDEVDGFVDVTKRTIVYYTSSENADFNPEVETYKMSGAIGGQKDSEMAIGPDEGFYMLSSGRRELKIAMFNPADNTLMLYAYLKSSDMPIGIFDGKVVDGEYKGVFTNYKTEGKVDFKLKIKEL